MPRKFRQPKLSSVGEVSRRDVFRIGGLALSVSGLAEFFAAEASSAQGKPRIKSCLVLFQAGGVSHIDTFDMKPKQTHQYPRRV